MSRLKITFKCCRFLCYAFLLLTMLSLLQTKVFDKREATPFSGDHWHNPYQQIAQNEQPWQKGNFHAHGRNFFGLSNGHGTDYEISKIYRDSLGYDWAAISNYQKVGLAADSLQLIRAYEHGIGIGKHHQLVMGDSKSSWFDFPILQFFNQKQTTINYLKKEDNLVVLAHPKLRGAYSLEDMKSLSGYDCLEVLNHIGRSREHWDAALSAGLPIYLISSDDSHDYHDLSKSGQNVTVFKTQISTEKGVLHALKSGHAFGVDIKSGSRWYHQRKNEIASLSLPTRFEIRKDSLYVAFNQVFSNIKFIGQNGIVRFDTTQSKQACYLLKEEDTYIRVVANFNQPGADLYFNPVFRYSKKLPENTLPLVNIRRTRLYRFSVLYLMLGLMVFIWQFEFVSRKNQKTPAKIKWALS